jgi:high-affinity nickel permease
MFGLDDRIASYSDGTGVLLVILVAVLLGLRHATDPDHVAAVSTIAAAARRRAARGAAVLGAAWGLGHAATLFLFGLPILLFDAYLPERAQQAAETAVAAVIVLLAISLLRRWRRGELHPHAHPHAHDVRSPLQSFGVGLVHGIGGSAGVGILIVAAVESQALSLVALAVLAVFTAVSMTSVTTVFGGALAKVPIARFAPALGTTSLAFGVWYAGAAWSLVPYPF